MRNDQATRTFVVAPQFFSHRDAHKHNLAPETLIWTLQSWKEGNASRCRRASSFDVLDGVLVRFACKERFPDLIRVVVAGHSAGAQLVQRYAAASPAGDALRARAVAVRYVVANPSSYLYLDRSRPSLEVEGGAAGRSVKFEACPEYNSYKYGLEALNTYLAAVGPESIRQRYGEREVIYLLGKNDDDPYTKNLDRSCAARLQGATRLERGLAFHAHLRRFYGEDIVARHVLEIVPDIGHQGPRILRSDAGRRWLFRG
jgi:pimeloyl-ACP methyl ester carboxylesterase